MADLSRFNRLKKESQITLDEDEIALVDYVKFRLGTNDSKETIIAALSIIYTAFEVNLDVTYIYVKDKHGKVKKIPLK